VFQAKENSLPCCLCCVCVKAASCPAAQLPSDDGLHFEARADGHGGHAGARSLPGPAESSVTAPAGFCQVLDFYFLSEKLQMYRKRGCGSNCTPEQDC
jgi:hypothetical protein